MKTEEKTEKKTKKKRTKKQLIRLLVIYAVVAVGLLAGLFVYLRVEQNKAEREWQELNAGEKIRPLLEESGDGLKEIIEEGEQIPEKEIGELVEDSDQIWEVQEIRHCLTNLHELKGVLAFESFGDYKIPEENRKKIREILDIFEKRKWEIGFIVMDIQTGKGVAYNCDDIFYSASSVKGTYMVSLIANEPQALEDYGYCFDAIAETSDNVSYNTLWYEYGIDYFNQWCDKAGIERLMDEYYNYIWYSPRQLSCLWMVNYEFFLTDKQYGKTAMALFDHPGYSTIHTTLGDFYDTWTKSGWINTREDAVIDSGIISDGEHPFLIVVMTDYGGDLLELNQLTCELEKVHADMIGERSKLSNAYCKKIKDLYPIGYWWG